MSNILSDYLSRPELAVDVDRSIRTLERWESKRIGPPVTRIGKTPYYRKDAVRDWLLNQERRTVRRRAEQTKKPRLAGRG